jgi:NifU-like protein involved in Fe-S cluster formation
LGGWYEEKNLMTCTPGIFNIFVQLDKNDNLLSFKTTGVSCGKSMSADFILSDYLNGKPIKDLFKISLLQIVEENDIEDDEEQFIYNLKWDALKCALAQYIGLEDDDIEKDRCQIISVDDNDKMTQITGIILPPQEISIKPCDN